MTLLSLLSYFAALIAVSTVVEAQGDPCASIAGKQWAPAREVRACYKSFPYREDIKMNIVEVINKTMNFHTSTNYQIQAPAPFDDVHLDIKAELSRISSQTYDSDFDMHIDIARTTRKMGDGHSVYVNMCYDSTYISYVPVPVVLLEDPDGSQNIYIDPVAWDIFAQSYFREPGQLAIWESALGNIPYISLPGAKVIAINGEDPWKAVNANAEVAGSYQSFATRQNGFFSSYVIANSEFSYLGGQFAQIPWPLQDSVTMTIQRKGQSSTDTITLPFLSRFHDDAVAFTDGPSFWQNNCLLPSESAGARTSSGQVITPAQEVSQSVASRFTFQPQRNETTGERVMVNTVVDVLSAPHIPMPQILLPGRVEFRQTYDLIGWMLKDEKTALISVGRFGTSIAGLTYLIQDLAKTRAERLIIDLSNNPGGAVCGGAYLHYLLSGQRQSTDPQALLPTKFRVNPLAQNIVDQVISGGISENDSMYHPANHKDENNVVFSPNYNYLEDKTVRKRINGKDDLFSQTIGQECQPWYLDPPVEPLFRGEIVIASNGRCASTCALFSTVLAKKDNVKVVSIGGQKGTPQQYAGTVGGESTNYSEIDREIKLAGLKNDLLAPPDFITNSYQGLTWRLANGASNPSEPEEWQSRPADMNFQLTADIVNRPYEMWNALAGKVFA